MTFLLFLKENHVLKRRAYSRVFGGGVSLIVLTILSTAVAFASGGITSFFGFRILIGTVLGSLLVWTMLLSLFTAHLYSVAKQNQHPEDRRLLLLLFAFTLAMVILAIVDIIVYAGVFEEHYSSRICTAYIGIVFSTLLLKDFVSTKKIEITFGRLNQDVAKVLHDLKPVASNLRMISNRISKTDADLAEILDSIAVRVGDSVAKINGKIRDARSNFRPASVRETCQEYMQVGDIALVISKICSENLSYLKLAGKVHVKLKEGECNFRTHKLFLSSGDFEIFMENVILNSFEAKSTFVDIVIEYQGRQFWKKPGLVLSIKDNGSGLSPAQLREFQLTGGITTTKCNGSSTGVQTIIDSILVAGGKVDYRKRTDLLGGTEVSIFLPVGKITQ